ncbi:MAG: FtsH protease activity modulator HflK, partial [Desulfosalsimonadaceae bacterium]|nr:FtsH protease activity modulator HflK [Desulfosalsimonadaceae bacterium]
MNWDWEKLQQKQKERSAGSGGIKPPQMDEMIDKIKGYKFPGGWVLLVLAGFALYFVTSMVYTVDVNEVGVIQRFGKYIRTEMPGLNFKLPAGVEKVTKVKTRRVYKEEFGLMPSQSGVSLVNSTAQSLDESLMLTGDLNVGVVPWIVQYRIKDPKNYLFKVKDVTQYLRDLSEASMRLVVGDRSINEVISNREEIADTAKIWLQKELDIAETGIEIDAVELGNTNVPDPVQDSFNKVNQAVQEKEKLIYEAMEEKNRVIPRAKGEAEQTIKSAEGYATERVNEAKGDASRFVSQYEEYAKAKDVTRRRLYLEMVKLVFPNLGELYVIDSDQKNVL